MRLSTLIIASALSAAAVCASPTSPIVRDDGRIKHVNIADAVPPGDGPETWGRLKHFLRNSLLPIASPAVFYVLVHTLQDKKNQLDECLKRTIVSYFGHRDCCSQS